MFPKRRHRALLALAAVPAALLPVAGAAPAQAESNHVSLPDRIDLPDGFRPEGITTDGFDFFAGSMSDGRIVKGNVRTGVVVDDFTPGLPGRMLRGMVHDPRTDLVWTTGTESGGGGVILAVDAETGAVAHEWHIPDAALLNDLTVGADTVWVTDSRLDRLTRVPLDGDGLPVGDPAFVPLGGAWPGGGDAFRANGIRELKDGSLLVLHSTVGGLWRVDPQTGEAQAIEIEGGIIIGGDGLDLRGQTAFVVRGNDDASVTVLKLHYRRGTVTADWKGLLTAPGLDVPATGDRAGRNFYVVNARFGNASPATAEYWVSKLPAKV